MHDWFKRLWSRQTSAGYPIRTDVEGHVGRLTNIGYVEGDIIIAAGPDAHQAVSAIIGGGLKDHQLNACPTNTHPIPWDSVSTNAEALLGCQIGSYILQAIVGSGGSGIAYRAWDTKVGKQVCCKVFYPLPADFDHVVSWAARSFRSLAALDHPNLIRVYDFGVYQCSSGRSLYIVMELLEGLVLTQGILNITRPMLVGTFVENIALVLTRALLAAHTCRYIDEVGFEHTCVLHGDVKPANVLSRSNGSLVLLDFMMIDVHRLLDPRIIERRTPMYEQPLTGAVGTPGYMAPEQESRGIVTILTDIYGLGRTLQFCLDMIDAADEHREDLEAVLRNMVCRDPSHRPQSCGEVIRSLERVAQAA